MKNAENRTLRVYDYSDVRSCIQDAVSELDAARDAAGRVNLYPSMAPADARRQIDGVETILRIALEQLGRARDASAVMARRRLRTV